MLFSSDTARRFSQALVSLDAVHIAEAHPFIYTSGWASPVYVDARSLMSDVQLRGEMMDMARDCLAPLVARQEINAIVGVEASGIAFAAWMAERLSLPLLYLRKRPIGWGIRAQLEGRAPDKARVLLVDDVTTDGLSKIAAAQALRQTGTQVDDILVLLDFNVYPDAARRFTKEAMTLHALADWPHLYEALRQAGRLTPAQEKDLSSFASDPVTWSVEHGGIGK